MICILKSTYTWRFFFAFQRSSDTVAWRPILRRGSLLEDRDWLELKPKTIDTAEAEGSGRVVFSFLPTDGVGLQLLNSWCRCRCRCSCMMSQNPTEIYSRIPRRINRESCREGDPLDDRGRSKNATRCSNGYKMYMTALLLVCRLSVN